MKPELAPLPFVLTQAEKSKAAWARIAIEHRVRETNRRDQQRDIRLFMHQDRNAPQGAHLVRALGDGQANAQLLLHALLHPAQVGQAAQVFQPLQHLLFFAAREHQDAHIAAWRLE